MAAAHSRPLDGGPAPYHLVIRVRGDDEDVASIHGLNSPN